MSRSVSPLRPESRGDPDVRAGFAVTPRPTLARALAGAAVAVAGVCLGIVTLLWVTDDPSQAPAPPPVAVAQQPARQDPVAEDPVAGEPLAPAASPPAAVAPAPVAPAPPPLPSPVAQAWSPIVPITVLNNSRRTGLADRAAQRFAAGGWPVTATGNLRGAIPVTTVYYDAGLEASARALAADFDGVTRVLPRFAALPARGVVVVVTREFPA